VRRQLAKIALLTIRVDSFTLKKLKLQSSNFSRNVFTAAFFRSEVFGGEDAGDEDSDRLVAEVACV
jgi:hypothetical protein